MVKLDRDDLWIKAVSEYKDKLAPRDRDFINQHTSSDLDAIIGSLSPDLRPGPSGKPSSSTYAVSKEIVTNVENLTKIFAVFTTTVPEISGVIWLSVRLLSERSQVNSDTRSVFDQAVQNISSATPQFRAYEEVFADMDEVEHSMLIFYFKIIDFFLAALERMKSCSSWTHRIGVDQAPIAMQRATVEIQKQRKIVENTVAAANLVLQDRRHREIRELLTQMAINSKTTPKATLPCHVIPYSANPLFHGRREILDQIQAHLVVSRAQRSSFAISGLGGVGKTQIALKYIYEHLDEYPVVFWMNADTRHKLAESYINSAKRLHLEPEDSQRDAETVITVLKTWLNESRHSWLLIYDNADDLEVLKPFWPPGNHGCIIITSRNPAAARIATSGLQISPMSPDEGQTFFVSLLTTRGTDSHNSTMHNKARVGQIIKKLGYLPLAIVQVSNFILECDCTLEEFQELYRSAQQSNQGISDLQTSSTDLFYEYSLATVWKVSILNLSPNALKFLRLMSYFDPDDVPEQLLWEGAAKSTSNGLHFLRRGYPYFTALQELISRGLIIKAESRATAGSSTTTARSLTIHRLVQETVFHQLRTEEQAQFLEDALDLVLSAWPVNDENVFRMNAFWPTCSLYLPHVLALESRCQDATYLEPPDSLVRLFFCASWYLFERRMSEIAFPLLETARSICSRGGDVNPYFPKLLTAYGAVCLECYRLPESVKWFSEVVDIYRARYREGQQQLDGENEYDWLLATSLSDLGCARTGMGEYSHAEDLFNEALEIAATIADEKSRKDWKVHISHNLSRLYVETDRPEFALQLQFEYGDELAGGLIEENTQRGALFLYGIGNAYLALGRKKGDEGAQARANGFQYHTRALKARQQTCGEHYVTAISLHKVGVLLYEAGDYEAAASALDQAMSIFDEAFEAHREQARSLFYLSLVKKEAGDALESDRLLAEAWKHLTKITGKQRTPEFEKDKGIFNEVVFYVQN